MIHVDDLICGIFYAFIGHYILFLKNFLKLLVNEHPSFSPSSSVFLWWKRASGRVSYRASTRTLIQAEFQFKKLIFIISMWEIVLDVMRMTHHLNMTHFTFTNSFLSLLWFLIHNMYYGYGYTSCENHIDSRSPPPTHFHFRSFV